MNLNMQRHFPAGALQVLLAGMISNKKGNRNQEIDLRKQKINYKIFNLNFLKNYFIFLCLTIRLMKKFFGKWKKI